MMPFPEFPLQVYLKKMETIRNRKLMGGYELSKALGVSYHTLRALIDPNRTSALKASTLKKLRKFVDENE